MLQNSGAAGMFGRVSRAHHRSRPPATHAPQPHSHPRSRHSGTIKLILCVGAILLGFIVVFRMLPLHTTTQHIESAAAVLGPPEPPQPRVALLFFGLTRSLKFTMPSIESNIIAPLHDRGIPTDVFLHTYNDTDDVSSMHTNLSEWRLLNPTKHIITSQRNFISATHGKLAACWKVGTGWKSTKQVQQRNMLNLMCQLNSLRKVADLWHGHAATLGMHYKAVIFLRPDVLYIDPLPVDSIISIREGTVSVPDWAHFKGMNDRFAVVGPLTAAVWKERLMYTMQKCREKPLHSESFTFDFAVEKNLQVMLLKNFEFFRTRSSGTIPDGDDRLPGWEHAQEVLRLRREELNREGV